MKIYKGSAGICAEHEENIVRLERNNVVYLLHKHDNQTIEKLIKKGYHKMKNKGEK